MTNTMDFTNKSTQAAAIAAMNKLMAEYGKEKTMDKMFEFVSQQVKITREEFEEVFKKGLEQMASWENDDASSNEMKEEELDMVVGGSAWDWICDHKRAIIIGACALAMGATGAVLGATVYASAIGLSTAGSAVFGGFLGAVIGAGLGNIFTTEDTGTSTSSDNYVPLS